MLAGFEVGVKGNWRGVCKVFVTYFIRIAEDAEDTEDTEGGFVKMKSFVVYLLHVGGRSTIKDECATAVSRWMG